MLTINEGDYKIADVAQALGISEASVRARYRTRLARFNRPPSLLELSQRLPSIKQSHAKRLKLGAKWLTVPEIATLTNLPEASVRRRYAALTKRQEGTVTLADLLRIRTRKRQAMTQRNKLIIEQAERGESFAAIGKAFGMSRQAAQQIYKRGY